jgi:hypothetical protein
MTTEKPSPESNEEEKKRQEEANKLNQDNKEHGGQEGPDPTRYGDWEKGGRCTDF